MSMLDSFFNKGFKAAKCKTLLKLTIPRIKLLRNRREIQIKQMRRDIAKLLETGQEATARIRVEHIIREENMMAAQEIVELFCELISVRLPIIEAQRECPLDLKEAISSVCFAAPRCADLPELLQVQMLFASKYGKEFVSAATELLPECGVNRQLIELLSIRAPSPDFKLKLLKEIAEEHELDWDPAASESELLKTHEDLLNGPSHIVSGSKMPLPKEKHDEASGNSSDGAHREQLDSDLDFDSLDLPEVPKVSLRPTSNASPGPEAAPPIPGSQHPVNGHESLSWPATSEILSQKPKLESENFVEEKLVVVKDEEHATRSDTADVKEEKQFVPFISCPSLSSPSFSEDTSGTQPSFSRTKSEVNVDLHDVLAAAQAAAETAEKAATAARSAASLAQARISELTKSSREKLTIGDNENPFHVDIPDQSARSEKPHLYYQKSFGDSDVTLNHTETCRAPEDHQASEGPDIPSFDNIKVEYDSPPNEHVAEHASSHYQPQRLASMEDDTHFSYPNLFSSQNSNLGSNAQSLPGDSHSSR